MHKIILFFSCNINNLFSELFAFPRLKTAELNTAFLKEYMLDDNNAGCLILYIRTVHYAVMK